MAIDITAGGTERISHASSAAIDNLPVLTLAMWCRPTIINGFRQIISKNNNDLRFQTASTSGGLAEMGFNRDYTTTDCFYASDFVIDTSWQYLAASFDSGATPGGNEFVHFWRGTRTAAAARQSITYADDPVGSQASDAGTSLDIGDPTVGTSTFLDFEIAWLGMWNSRLTTAQVQEQQWAILDNHIVARANNVIFTHYWGTARIQNLIGPSVTTNSTVSDVAHVALPVSTSWFTPYLSAGATAYSLTAESGTFTLTGQASNLLFDRSLTADSGSFVLTGQDAGLTRDYTLTASAGSLTLTGQDAGLLTARLLSAGSGTFTLSGQDTGLLVDRSLTAGAGSFTLTGQTATLTRAYTLTAGAGTFTLTGQDTTLDYSGAAASLTAASGTFTLTGQDAGLLVNRSLTAGAGSFTLTGQDAGLGYGLTLTAASGTFTLTGQDATLTYTRRLTASAGSFTLTGQPVTLTYSGLIIGAVVGLSNSAAFTVALTDSAAYGVTIDNSAAFTVALTDEVI